MARSSGTKMSRGTKHCAAEFPCGEKHTRAPRARSEALCCGVSMWREAHEGAKGEEALLHIKKTKKTKNKVRQNAVICTNVHI